jgi:hypothetical protein
MKKTLIKKTSIVLSGLLLGFAMPLMAQTENEEITADVYEDASEEGKYINSDLQKIADRNSSSYWSRSMKDMFSLGAKAVYFEYDAATFFVKNMAGALKNQKATVVINPETQLAGWGSSLFASYYYFLLEEKSRAEFEKFVKLYLMDFDNKHLNRKEKQTYKKYGRAPVFIEWGMMKASTKYNAHGKAYFGYEFVDKSPYFTITLFARPNENVHESRNVPEEKTDSMNLKYYFTRAQLQTLLNSLSEKNLNAIISEYNSYLNRTTAIDEYDE